MDFFWSVWFDRRGRHTPSEHKQLLIQVLHMYSDVQVTGLSSSKDTKSEA